jgi:hypothetical protein
MRDLGRCCSRSTGLRPVYLAENVGVETVATHALVGGAEVVSAWACHRSLGDAPRPSTVCS